MKPLIVANWKMNGSRRDLESFVPALQAGLPDPETAARGIVCPPFPYLVTLAELTRGTAIGVGAQNVHASPKGAFTGEIAVAMLQDVGADTCIVGHSERRQLFGETDAQIREKLQALRGAGLLAILCVGETLDQRESDQHESVVEAQVRGALADADAATLSGLAVAYEPVWAIGTGKTATPEQANAMHAVIRRVLDAIVSPASGAGVPILYGGSVNADNAASLLGQPEINGALVGGASLKADSFLAIINQAKA